MSELQGFDELPKTDFEKIMDEYAKNFQDTFPTIPLMWHHSENWCMDVAKECIQKGKDVYELGYCQKVDDDTLI